MMHRLVYIYTCPNVTLLEITCRGSVVFSVVYAKRFNISKNWCYSVRHMFHSLDLLQLFENLLSLHRAKHVVAEFVDKIN